MTRLSDLYLRTAYHKGQDDIAEAFYLPCMRRAVAYDRAVGFFRSSVFVVAWPALREFVSRGGRMRVLCSHVLARADIEALEQGYSAKVEASLARHFVEEVRDLLRDEHLREPARVLAALVASGTIEVKVALVKDSAGVPVRDRIFHDKLGIFHGDDGSVVVFKGSMNETWTGLSSDGNLESVDVAASWMGARDLERAKYELDYFERVWKDRYPTLSVREFPQVARAELEASADPDWEATVERLTQSPSGTVAPDDPRGRTLRPHQAAGLASWRANCRQGILCFATGSGKTFTAISAIRDAITEHSNPVVVVVPDQVLFGQWLGELEETLADLDVGILRAGAGNTGWRKSLRLWTEPGEKARLTLATVQTARTDDFRRRLCGGPHLLLVADEVHRLGSRENRKLLDESLFGPRLGLSATPERAGDPEGTQALLAYFRGILEPRYTLADAVNDGVLTKYFYRPHAVPMSAEEAEEWEAITSEISRLYARAKSDDAPSPLNERLKRLLLKRARVVKHASAKVPLAVRVFQDSYVRGQRWIVYCENLEQLGQVREALSAAGFSTMEFHAQMEGDRSQTLKWLDRRGGVVVAIKCLDEGVDVPSVTHALILASSKNPREFIQRRGRVLRKHPGKALAYVHDAIVVPPRREGDDDQRRTDPIILGELARALEFAEHADNPSAAVDLQAVAIDAGIDWRKLTHEGVEDEDD